MNLKPGILDRYIIKKFLGTFALTIALFMIIIIVFDVSEKIDDFFEKKAPLSVIIFTYYFNYIPYFLNTFSPIFIFISVIYFTSRLAMRSEFISMLAAGVPFKRILLPYVICAALLALLSYVLNSWVIPIADKKRMEFENHYIRGYWSQFHGNVHRQIAPGTMFYMEYFNSNDSTGGGVQLERYSGDRLQSKLFAERIDFNKLTGKWRLGQVVIRDYGTDGNEIIRHGIRELDTALTFNPKDFFLRPEDNQSLNNNELRAFIRAEKERGASNVEAFETELARRYAAPFSTFVLTLIGVCVASRKLREGLGFHLGVGIAIIIIYLFIFKYFISLGVSGNMWPTLSVWLPNILFTGVAWWFYRKAQK